MEFIQQNDKVLFLWDRTFDPSTVNTDELKSEKNVAINFENIERLALGTWNDKDLKQNLFSENTSQQTEHSSDN